MRRYPDLEIDLLRAFVAVAETGGFTEATGLLGRTQSAVSQKIRRLEELLDRKVFERTSRSVGLTHEGETLLGHARRILAMNDAAVRALAAPCPGGTLRLGVSEDFIPHQLPRLLARFGRIHPGIRMELRTGLSCALLTALDAGELDLALAKRDGDAQRGRVIWREPLAWVAAEDWRLPPPDVPLPLVLLPAPCSYRRITTDALDGAGRSWTIACTGHGLMAVQAAVAGGLGLTVLGRGFVQPGLRELIGVLPSLPMTEIVLVGEQTAQAHLAAPLVEFLTEALSTPARSAA
jgi:DNA-binding transcriptional LysR family regulator